MHVVYQLFRNTDYQFVWAVDDHSELITDGTSKRGNWKAVSVFNRMPTLKATDFYQYHPSSLIIGEKALKAFGQPYLETYSEVLPLTCNEAHCPEAHLHLINVTQCLNCLDHDRTVWKGLSRIIFLKPVFRVERLPWPGTLFKIPESRGAAVYLYEDTLASSNSFREFVEHFSLQGLVFEKLWHSE